MCLALYCNFLDPEFGRMHVRMRTRFPFTLQLCVKGRRWPARKMQRHGMDHAFLWIEDPARARRFADRMTGKRWVPGCRTAGSIL